MKKIIIAIVLPLILLACGAKDGIKEEVSNNDNFQVSTLFTYDSITVYRFLDNGRYHYFTRNSVTSLIKEGKHWREEYISGE